VSTVTYSTSPYIYTKIQASIGDETRSQVYGKFIAHSRSHVAIIGLHSSNTSDYQDAEFNTGRNRVAIEKS
jgi:hypothetical protein